EAAGRRLVELVPENVEHLDVPVLRHRGRGDAQHGLRLRERGGGRGDGAGCERGGERAFHAYATGCPISISPYVPNAETDPLVRPAGFETPKYGIRCLRSAGPAALPELDPRRLACGRCRP